MFIETIHKLKLRSEEAETLKKCETLLEDILHDFRGNDLSDVDYDEIALASDVLQRLYDGKELY
jgi:hypothetical protein